MRTEFISPFAEFYKNWGFYLEGLSDCEELVGLLTGNGVGLGAKSSDSTELY